MTQDITIHGASGSVRYRYEGPDKDHMRLIGSVLPNGYVVALPPERPLPPPTRDAEGVPFNPTVPRTDTLFTPGNDIRSRTQEAWDGIKDIPSENR
jgi:hypothetical protein